MKTHDQKLDELRAASAQLSARRESEFMAIDEAIATHRAAAPRVPITAELTEDQAWELAQFLKRISFDGVLRYTDGGDDKRQAYTMIAGLETVRRSLVSAGYAPR